MEPYKEMYLHLMRETERAVRILTEAQQACEELYLRADEPNLSLVPPPPAAPRKTRKTSSISSEKPLTNENSADILDKPL